MSPDCFFCPTSVSVCVHICMLVCVFDLILELSNLVPELVDVLSGVWVVQLALDQPFFFLWKGQRSQFLNCCNTVESIICIRMWKPTFKHKSSIYTHTHNKHTHLNLEFSYLLPEFSHGSHTVCFPQPHCHHLLFTLNEGGGRGGRVQKEEHFLNRSSSIEQCGWQW